MAAVGQKARPQPREPTPLQQLRWPPLVQSRKAALEPLVLCNTQLRAVSPLECSALWPSRFGCGIAVTLLCHSLPQILRIASSAQHHFRKRNVRALLGRELELRPTWAKHTCSCVQQCSGAAHPKAGVSKDQSRESTPGASARIQPLLAHTSAFFPRCVLPQCAVSRRHRRACSSNVLRLQLFRLHFFVFCRVWDGSRPRRLEPFDCIVVIL